MKYATSIACLLVALQAASVIGFAPSALQSKHITCPSSTFPSTHLQQCSIINRGSNSRLYMSDAAVPPKKGFMEKIKSKIPPANERKKLIPLASMFFFILFNYTILRDTKDVLMVTAKKSGAEVIPFIKTYVNLPAAIGFTALYSKLCDRMEQKDVFYACTIPFLIFFLAFAYVIFPNVGVLHPHAFVDKIALALPEGFSAPLAIVRNWSFAVFYVMAEMWGSVVASLLFWSFANEVTTVEEAKKYYPLFGLGANVALIFSGQYVRFVSAMRENLPPGIDPWGMSLKYLMGAVVASGGCLVSIFSYMQRKVMTDPNCVDQEKQAAKKKKKKVKMGLRDSAKFLMSSPYIRDLATLVISYGMCINLVEVSWKSKLKAAYPDPNAYSSFMGNFSSATGAVTLVMMLLGRKIFQKFGWRNAAMVTPSMIGITGLAFYALTLFAPFFEPIAAGLGTTPLMLAVIVGAAQNILSKSSKYSLFDPCKEMAYIPLDQDSKTKGKAAVDVVGNPLGKSGGALIQQFLIFGVGSLAASTPWLAGILGVLLFFWYKAVNSLAGQFEEAMEASGESA
jgi:AAA family ATP:ADP antiporter